jgi:16S rRNA (adenine1518-N6/adenine1519-N6)-dimethyltransferase
MGDQNSHDGAGSQDRHAGDEHQSEDRPAEAPVAGSRDPDALRARAGVRGNPDADQHFLVDDRVLDRLPGYATDAGFDCSTVLEVGGGTGALTDRLLAAAGRVVVVERDPRLAAFLREEFAPAREAGRLTVVEGDALAVELPAFSASVSNLPYGVSSEIAFRLLPERRPMVATFQREFAERMAADPGTSEYGRLSVTAGHYADIEVVETVPPEAFDPQPAVESAVVRARPRQPDYEVPDDEFFMRFLRAVFTQRRKTMRNAIRNTGHISGLDDPDAVVDAAGEELMGRRAGNLAPATFARLARRAWEHGDPGEPTA